MAGNYGIDEWLRDITGIGQPEPGPQVRIALKPPGPKPVVASQGKGTSAPKPSTLTPSPAPAATGGSKGDRNRNPGNLEDGKFAQSQPGYKGSDGRFAIFDTPENGIKAQETLLLKNYRGMTPAQIVQKYSPLGDNSEASVRNYIGYIAARAGVGADTPVPDAAMTRIAAAKREFETGRTVKGMGTPYAGQLRGAGKAVPGGGSGSPGMPTSAQDWLDSVVPEAGKATNPAGLTGEQSSAFFGEASKGLNTRRAALETSLDSASQGINVLDAAVQAAQAVDLTQRAQQVQDTRKINDTLTTGINQLTEEAKPVFEARNRVANQLQHNATVNPIEKALRGIFDSNYDDDFLKGQLDTFQTVLDAKGYNYDYMNKLSNDAVKMIDQRYGLNMADTMLGVSQATEDLSLVQKHVENLNAMMNSGQENLQVQSQIIVAQDQARKLVLSQADEPTLQQAFATSEKSGGQTTLGGAQFASTDLRNELQAREDQRVAVRSHQLAIAGGELDLADKIAKDIAFKASRSDLELAGTNGGMIQGVQIPQDVLAAALANQRSIADGQAADAVNRMPDQLAYSQLASLTKMSTQLYERSKGIVPSTAGAPLEPFLRPIADSSRNIMTQIQAGAAPEVISSLLTRHEKLVDNFSKTIDDRILSTVGGDKVLGGALTNFVRGIPMSEGTTLEVLTRSALKGSLPSGLSLGPEAKAVFKKAQDIVSAHRYSDKKGTLTKEDDLLRIVTDELGPQIQSMMGNPRLERTLNNLPSYAKEAGNALGRLKPEWWARTLSGAGEAAIGQYATELTRMGITSAKLADGSQIQIEKPVSFTRDEVAQIMSGTYKDSMTPAGKIKVQAVQDNSGLYNGFETQHIVGKLESVQPLDPKTTNSELFEDFLSSPELVNRLTSEEETVRQHSFGDFLLGPVARGATANTLNTYRQSVAKVNRARDDQGYEDNQLDTRIINNPRARASMIGITMAGVGSTGMQKLDPLVREFYKDKVDNGINWTGGKNPQTELDVEFYNWLSTQKSPDPVTESYRKRYVNEYPEASKWLPKVHAAIMESRLGVRAAATQGR